jgi:hypothetical protein
LEEGLEALGLQDWPGAFAEDARSVGSVGASAALEASVSEIEFGDGITAATDEEWTPTNVEAKAGANPAQWHDLIIAWMVIKLNVL